MLNLNPNPLRWNWSLCHQQTWSVLTCTLVFLETESFAMWLTFASMSTLKKKRVYLFPWTWSPKIVFCVYFTKLLWECAFNNSFRFHSSNWLLKNVWRRNSCSVHFNSMVWSRSLISAVTRLKAEGLLLSLQTCLSVWESVCVPLQVSRNAVIVLNDLLDGYISVCAAWNVPVSEWFNACNALF